MSWRFTELFIYLSFLVFHPCWSRNPRQCEQQLFLNCRRGLFSWLASDFLFARIQCDHRCHLRCTLEHHLITTWCNDRAIRVIWWHAIKMTPLIVNLVMMRIMVQGFMQGTSNLYYGSVKSSLSDALNGPDGEQLQRASICLMLFSQAAVQSACRLLVTDIMGRQSAIIRAAVPNVSGCVLSQTARCTRRARLQACTHVVVLSWRRFKEKSRKIIWTRPTARLSAMCLFSNQIAPPAQNSGITLEILKKEANLSFSSGLQSKRFPSLGVSVYFVCMFADGAKMSLCLQKLSLPRKSQNLWDESPLVID